MPCLLMRVDSSCWVTLPRSEKADAAVCESAPFSGGHPLRLEESALSLLVTVLMSVTVVCDAARTCDGLAAELRAPSEGFTFPATYATTVMSVTIVATLHLGAAEAAGTPAASRPPAASAGTATSTAIPALA